MFSYGFIITQNSFSLVSTRLFFFFSPYSSCNALLKPNISFGVGSSSWVRAVELLLHKMDKHCPSGIALPTSVQRPLAVPQFIYVFHVKICNCSPLTSLTGWKWRQLINLMTSSSKKGIPRAYMEILADTATRKSCCPQTNCIQHCCLSFAS